MKCNCGKEISKGSKCKACRKEIKENSPCNCKKIKNNLPTPSFNDSNKDFIRKYR
jgi:hypothetical protein